MSTDYTHFTNLAFTNLFARGPDGQEVVIYNSSGIFVGTQALSVSKLTANGVVIGSAANVVAHVNQLKSTSNLIVKTAGTLAISGTLTVSTAITGSQIASASSSASGVITTGTQSFAGTKTFVTALAGSNVASASSSASGVVTTGAQSFAGAKTFVTALAGSNVVSASTSASGVVSTGAQSFAGSKTFTTALAGSNVVSASSSASGVMTTGTQSFAGTKTFVTPLLGASVASASSSASGVITTGAQTFAGAKTFSGTTTLSGKINVATGTDTTSIVEVDGNRTQNLLSGTTQRGVTSWIGGTSAATSVISAFHAAPGTQAASFTCATLCGYNSGSFSKGASSIITSAIAFVSNGVPSVGTNNAILSDSNVLGSGNFFLYQGGTNASQLGGVLTAASFIPSSSSAPTNGLYLSAANTVALSSNSTLGLSLDSTQNLTLGSANTTTNTLKGNTLNWTANTTNCAFNQSAASGGTASHIFTGRTSSTGAPQGLIRAFYNDGSTSNEIVHIDLSNTTSATAASCGGRFAIQTRIAGGALTTAFNIDQLQQVTIGAGTSGQHTLNTLLGTAASGAGTLLTLPSGKSGNPTGYIQMTINGSTGYIPYW